MTRAHALPKHVHLMAKGRSVTRLCGSTTGGYVRLNDEGKKWLKKFLEQGGGLCPECEKRREEAA
jgi:hypothetical protein